MMTPINVITLASEAAPFVKIGGLGDVAGTLPVAIRTLEPAVDIRLFLPYYPFLDLAPSRIEKVGEFSVPHVQGGIAGQVHRTALGELPVYLVSGDPISRSPSVYSSDAGNDGLKFVFFSLAVLEAARILGFQPDVLHAHDWHTAPAVYALSRLREKDPFFARARSLLTVHNLPYLGSGTEAILGDFALPPAVDSPLPPWARQLPLPLGLLSADRINTVSWGYAREILTPEFGSGLEGFLKTRARSLSGILNGIDPESWDPAADPALAFPYRPGDFETREKNKAALLEELGLKCSPDTPLLAMINRMDYQKGVDLVPPALRMLKDSVWCAVILGTGDPGIEQQALQLDIDFPHIRSILRYDGALARQIYAGADMIIIPSRYEPCGLTQMIAMRYGCVPVARATGGLRDTITDYAADDNRSGPLTSTGFLFKEASPEALTGALKRALAVYGDQRRWRGLQRRGMKEDFSWKRSAAEYVRLYKEMVGYIPSNV